MAVDRLPGVVLTRPSAGRCRWTTTIRTGSSWRSTDARWSPRAASGTNCPGWSTSRAGRAAPLRARWAATPGCPGRSTTTAYCCWTSAAPDVRHRPTGRPCPLRGGPAEQAAYLAHFRADAIVRDAELFRRRLVADGAPWSVLGQSFGGFCSVAYLSRAPEGLSAAYLTGGLPGIDASAEDVYLAAYPRVARKNAAHYARYPQDVAAAKEIAAHLRERTVRLPGGGLLTAEAFQALGLMLGSGTGSHTLHHLVTEAWVTGPGGPELADAFLHAVQGHLSLRHHPAVRACCTRRSTGSARSIRAPPAGRRSACAPASRSSTWTRRWPVTGRCISPAR